MIEIELSGGIIAELTSLVGERVSLRSAQAAAPGSRLDGVVLGDRHLRIKVHRCLRSGDRFEIEGRFFDLTRELRELLQERISAL
ncbi:MAG: hypothetical protein DRI90_21320 [Deltaproteobacteria bacterium]|nr:MAG: hypothetical protein DRI90_21320 [Deltaproteobacteria bacterium]